MEVLKPKYKCKNEHRFSTEKICAILNFLTYNMPIVAICSYFLKKKHEKSGIARDFFYTWKNQKIFIEFYWDSEDFFKNSLVLLLYCKHSWQIKLCV